MYAVYVYQDTSSMTRLRGISFALLIVTITYAVIAIYTLFPFTIDDAFISLRYAKHLSLGHGLIWNLGGERVEGYSNFLWVLIEAFLFKLNMPTLFIVKILGVVCLILSGYFLYKLSRLFLSVYLSLICACLLLLHRGEILWSVSGLETLFFQALLLLTVLILFIARKQKKNRYFLIVALLSFALSITRIEGVGITALFLLLLFIEDVRDTKCFVERGFLTYLMTYSVLIIPVFFFRYHYYGHLFPNPVYCKALFSSLPGYESYLYLKLIAPILVFNIYLLFCHYDRRIWYLLLPSILFLLGFLHADVVVAFDNRYFLPTFALLLPLLVLSLKEIATVLSIRDSESVVAITALLLCFLSFPKSTIKQMQQFALTNQSAHQFRIDIVHWIHHNISKNYAIALGDCGLIPYFSERTFIDTYCLNSKEMTLPPISLSYKKYVDWVLNIKKPEIIILLALVHQNTAYHPPFDIELISRAAFHQGYQHIKSFRLGNNKAGYLYDVFQSNLKKDNLRHK